MLALFASLSARWAVTPEQSRQGKFWRQAALHFHREEKIGVGVTAANYTATCLHPGMATARDFCEGGTEPAVEASLASQELRSLC